MEVFGYTIGFFPFIITIFAVTLTYQAWKNGRWMKQAHEDTHSWMKQAHEETQALIKENHKET